MPSPMIRRLNLITSFRERLNDLPPNSTELSWGNSVYTIKFDDRVRKTYGQRYSFFLKDAVDDVPEYVVHWEEFER